MSLSIILKRKREQDNNNEKDIEGGFGSSVSIATAKNGNYTIDCPEGSKVIGIDEEQEEGMIPTEEELPNDGQTSAKGNTPEVKDVDAMGDQKLENNGQRDRESDYEAGEGGDSNQKR